MLLCANCHRELHDNLWDINEITVPKFVDIMINTPRDNQILCSVCGVEFIQKKSKSSLCSRKCVDFSRRRIKNRPSTEVLLGLLKEYNYVQLGKMFGVSDNAVRKWLK